MTEAILALLSAVLIVRAAFLHSRDSLLLGLVALALITYFWLSDPRR